MAGQDKLLNITEVSFDGIKRQLRSYLKEQPAFSDYNYEGSNMNVLINVLAQNAYYQNFLLNSMHSEIFLPSARRRNSVVSKAKELGYFPTSAKSAYINVNIVHTSGTEPNPGAINISASANNLTYNFVLEDYGENVSFESGRIDDVRIVEGRAYTNRFTITPTTNKLSIPNRSVDTSSIRVENVSTGEVYRRIESTSDIINIDGESAIFWAAEDIDGYYAIYFGDGEALGKRPDNDSIISVKYLVVNSEGAPNLDGYAGPFNIAGPAGFAGRIEVPTGNTITRGQARETIESIKQTAPLLYSSQNRAITENDYRGLIQQKYGERYKSVKVWGGEDNDPPSYGSVFIALIQENGRQITSSTRTAIEQDLRQNHSVAGITPIVVNGAYTYLSISGDIVYDAANTTQPSATILRLARNAITGYGEDNLEKFGNIFRYTILSNLTNEADSAIVSNRLDVKLTMNIVPVRGVPAGYTLNYDNALRSGTVRSTTFEFNDTPACWLADDGNGNVGVYRSGTGNDTVLLSNVGTLNASEGKIVLNSFKVNDYTDNIRISVEPVNNYGDLETDLNRVFRIQEADINLTAVRV